MIDVLELPFDQYQRYRLVADLLEEVRPRSVRLRVLDVGGRTALLRSFLPHDEIVLVDLEASQEPALVLGDGSRLPFADSSFDVVAAFDTLEHVPPDRRDAFVTECRRVARSWVVLAGPYHSRPVEEAEQILQQFLRDKLAVEHRYLDEHRHHGLPDREQVERRLRVLGGQVASIGHGNLERWLALLCLSMYMDYRPELRTIATRFHRFYNEKLYASDTAEPVYRHAVVAAFAGARLPPLHSGAAPLAPPGATERISELAYELVDLERVRESFEEERARLLESQRVLRADLSGHKQRLAELALRSSEQREVIDSLSQDLDGHKRSKSALERDLVQHREHVATLDEDLQSHRSVVLELRARTNELERECERQSSVFAEERARGEAVRKELTSALGEHQQVIGTLEADLAGHRAALSALEADLANHRSELALVGEECDRLRADKALIEHEQAQQRKISEELEAERDDQREVIAVLETDLNEHRKVLTTLESDLSGHRALVVELRRQAELEKRHSAELQGALDAAHAALHEARSAVNDAHERLRERDARILVLRRELRSRWRNLVRVFGRKMPID